MKWMLIALLTQAPHPSVPIKTNLLFDTLDECLRAEEAMRGAYTRAYNKWLAWARQETASGYPATHQFQMQRIIPGASTCIPHSERLLN